MVINSVRPSDPFLSFVVLLKRSVIRPPRCVTKARETYQFYNHFIKAFFILYNVLHFDRKCSESHSVSFSKSLCLNSALNYDVKKNKINSVLSMLESFLRDSWTTFKLNSSLITIIDKLIADYDNYFQ